MGVPLEVSIARLIGDPAHLKEQPEFYPEAPAVYVAVSYTHLDVYKRQTPLSASML